MEGTIYACEGKNSRSAAAIGSNFGCIDRTGENHSHWD